MIKDFSEIVVFALAFGFAFEVADYVLAAAMIAVCEWAYSLGKRA